MIHAVIFDWGGVLMRTTDAQPRLTWDARLGLEPGSVNHLVFDSAEWRRAQLGQIGDDEFWANVGARLNLSDRELAELRRDFWAGDQLDAELVSIIRGLRPRFKIGLLSNFSTGLRTCLMDYGVLDAFDAVVISAEVQLLKPDPRVYQLAAQRLGVQPGECMFVDDFAENIAGAQAAGMQALHFSPVDSAILQLRQLIVLDV